VASQRMGAAIAALVAVNFVGAMFAVAPVLLGLSAVICGTVWPNWVGDTIKRVKDVVEETRARGRGESVKKVNNIQAKEKLPFVEKTSFHYYIGSNGKKRWYRSGQSSRRFDSGKPMGIFSFIPGVDGDEDSKNFWDFNTFLDKIPNGKNDKRRQQ